MTADDGDGFGPDGGAPGPRGRRRRTFWSPRRERGLFILAMVVAAGSLWWAGFRVMGPDPTTALPEPGMGHVHALGVDPADGALFVATHSGMFRIAGDQPARRVGGNYQDTTGFAVAGPGRFLGSGHPDLEAARDGAPGRLGLLESTNAAVTWTAVSLEGAAGFRGLSAVHGQVWGWESETRRFMVSADRRTWDVRSVRDMLAFAVDPGRADHVIAAGPDGLVASSDGGRTWPALAGPRLTTVSWDARSGLLGADADGTVHRSADGGATWQAVGVLPGPPQAILATPGELWAAADDGAGPAVYVSRDGGRRWLLRHRDAEQEGGGSAAR